MQETVCINSSRPLRKYSKKMYVDALDVATSYINDQQHLKLAVSIADLSGCPVHRGEVELVIDSPNGIKFTLTAKTDLSGVAFFKLDNVERGRWEFVVFNINHPDYISVTSTNRKHWSITYV